MIIYDKCVDKWLKRLYNGIKVNTLNKLNERGKCIMTPFKIYKTKDDFISTEEAKQNNISIKGLRLATIEELQSVIIKSENTQEDINEWGFDTYYFQNQYGGIFEIKGTLYEFNFDSGIYEVVGGQIQ